MRITNEVIEKARNAIQEAPSYAPPDPTFTKTRAIWMLADEIDELLNKKNYTLDQAAEILGQAGITIAPSTLKGVLYDAKNKRTAQRGASAHQPFGHADLDEEASAEEVFS